MPPPSGMVQSRLRKGSNRCRRCSPPTTIERCETELGWEFVQIYGLTETAPLLTMNRGREEWDDLSSADEQRC